MSIAVFAEPILNLCLVFMFALSVIILVAEAFCVEVSSSTKASMDIRFSSSLAIEEVKWRQGHIIVLFIEIVTGVT